MKNSIFELLGFYAKLFLCRWNEAIVNWLMFYLVVFVFAYIGAKYRVISGGEELWYIHLISISVTMLSALLSLKVKYSNNQINKLQDNKIDGIDT